MKTKRIWCLGGIILGSLLTLGPIWGLLGTVLGMIRAFATLANTGIKDPADLSHQISGVLMSSLAGILCLPIGIVLLVLCLRWWKQINQPTPPPVPVDMV